MKIIPAENEKELFVDDLEPGTVFEFDTKNTSGNPVAIKINYNAAMLLKGSDGTDWFASYDGRSWGRKVARILGKIDTIVCK